MIDDEDEAMKCYSHIESVNHKFPPNLFIFGQAQFHTSLVPAGLAYHSYVCAGFGASLNWVEWQKDWVYFSVDRDHL